jgi:hypothetical protein
MNQSLNQLPDTCLIQLSTNVTVPDMYALWWIEDSYCLQYISDLIVNATVAFVDKKTKYRIPE